MVPKKRKTLRKASDQKLKDAVYMWFVQKRGQSEHDGGSGSGVVVVVSIFAGYNLQTIS